LCHARKYVKLLGDAGVRNASQVMPGIDFDLYKLRSSKRPKFDKLIVGWVGKSYQSSNRKNEQLLRKLSTLTFIDLRITGGKLKDQDLPKFYGDCDIIVSPSLVEGGSMAITEAQAVGTPVLSYTDVGVSDEFDFGVLKAPYNDEKAFILRLAEFWRNKEYEEYRKPENLQRLRSQVEQFTWHNFAKGHDEIWENLLHRP